VDTVDAVESAAGVVVAAGPEPIALVESVGFVAGSPEARLTGTV
jgi:hypothetical protein